MWKMDCLMWLCAVALCLALLPSARAASLLDVPLQSYADARVHPLTRDAGFGWSGGLEGGFMLFWSDGYILLKPKLVISGVEYAFGEMQKAYPDTKFVNSVSDLNSKYEWEININGLDSKAKAGLESVVFDVAEVSGIGEGRIRNEGSYIIVDDKYAISFFDLMETLPLKSASANRMVFTIPADAVADGSLMIDPYVLKYPFEDGYLERNEFGVFEVYLTATPMKIGSSQSTTDSLYRAYLKFNTSSIDPWDTIVNATFRGYVSPETCGSGSSKFWLQNISNYGDLGSSDWTVSYQNMSIFFDTATNSSGWHQRLVTGFINKGSFTYYRIKGTYETYGGVDCFIGLRANESGGYEPKLMIWYTEGVPPAVSALNITIHNPKNTTYTATSRPLQVSANATVSKWWYKLNAGSNTTFTPNTTITAAYGSNLLIVYANNSAGVVYSRRVRFTVSPSALNITIHNPKNTTYSSASRPLQVMANASVSKWWYKLNAGSNTTFTPNTTITAAYGSNLLIVYANNSAGVVFSKRVRFRYLDITPPNIIIASPKNQTYGGVNVPLNVFANETVGKWWYQFNNGSNVTFTPNMTIPCVNGTHKLTVYANDTYGNTGKAVVWFTNIVILPPYNVTLVVYYPTFAAIGRQVLIQAMIENATGYSYPNATLHILIDTVNASMAWNGVTKSYEVIWIPSANGDYVFTVFPCGTPYNESGMIYVRTPFNITVSIWNDINMTKPYENDFAWIYAVYNLGNPKLKELFGQVNLLACPPEGAGTCYWHARYANGTAELELPFEGNYTLYIIGNNIRWEQDIGSGYIQPCQLCPPVEIQKRLLLNLGNYYFDGSESLHLFYSQAELYASGGFFGVLGSWLYVGVMFALALAAFFIVLWATHSLYSAMAALVIMPTVIWMILQYLS